MVAVGGLDWSWFDDPTRRQLVEHLQDHELGSSEVLATLARLVCSVTGAPLAQISLIGSHQTVPASCGFSADPAAATPADESLCSVTIASGGPLAVTDAREHPWVRSLPPVTSGQVRSYVGVPLVTAEGHALGAICAFGPEVIEWSPGHIDALADISSVVVRELALVADLGSHVTLIDHLGAALQDLVLPTALPEVAMLEIAARYEQAEGGLKVGGDWYDCFQVTDDRFSWAVGDVAGHGLPAAATMAQLRSALRAYALVGGSPSTVVAQLNHLLADLAPERLASLAYCELGLATGRLRLTVAGLTPPLLLTGAGARYLDQATEPPLGALPERLLGPAEQEVKLAAGDTVVLFSDGLVERRSEGIDVGLERLRQISEAAASAPVDELCDRLVSAMTAGSRTQDDLCVLVVRYRGN